MNELNSVKTHSDINTIPLSDQTNFRLNEIDKIKDYFIKEKEAIRKKLSIFLASLDYMDKILIVLSATS